MRYSSFFIFSFLGTCLAGSSYAQDCGESSIVPPEYLELNRTTTESVFVGWQEFVPTNALPNYYLQINYAGAWTADILDTAVNSCDPLLFEDNVGYASATISGATLYDVTNGSRTETGLAEQVGYTLFSAAATASVTIDNLSVDFANNSTTNSFRLYAIPFGISAETAVGRTYGQANAALCDVYEVGTPTPAGTKLFTDSLSGSVAVSLLNSDTVDNAIDYYAGRGGTQVEDFGNEVYFVQDGRDVKYAEIKIKATFRACDGDNLVISVLTRTEDLTTSQVVEATETFRATGGQNNRVEWSHEIVPELNQRISILDIFATKEPKCSSDGGNPYASGASVDSLHWFTSVGRLFEGKSAGQLRIDQDHWSDLKFTSEDLSFFNAAPSQVTLVEVSGLIRQVAAPGSFADVVTLGSDSYRIDLYNIGAAGPPDSVSGIYPITGTAHTSYTISKQLVGLETRLRIVESGNGSIDQTDFAYSESGGIEEWTLYEGEGAREFAQNSEELASVPSGLESVDYFSRPYNPPGFPPFPWPDPPVYVSEIEQVKDSLGTVVSQVERIYQHVTLGSGFTEEFNSQAPTYTFELLRRERIYTDSLTTPDHEITYFYGTDDTQSDFTRLVRTEDSRGDWEKRRYDSESRLFEIESSYLDSSISDPVTSNRLVTYTYTDVTDQDSDGELESLVTRTESLVGSAIRRSFELDLSGTQTLNGILVSESRNITGVSPSANWDSVGNLVTREWEYADESSEFYLETYARSQADGTGRIHQMLRNGDGTITMTESAGALDDSAAPTTVTAGQVTVKNLDSGGVTQSMGTTDVESSLLVAQEFHTNFDDYGRAQRIDYLNGTYETRQYACCGLQSVTGADGSTTLYEYDDLKRVDTVTTGTGTADQLVEKRHFDPAGNLQSLQLGADENTLSTVVEYDYDYSGLLTESRERYLDAAPSTARKTTMVETIDGSGYLVTTTTYPNGSTQIVKRYPDGVTYEITGNAVRGTRTSYATVTDGALGYPVQTNTVAQLKGDGSLSGQWTKTYTNALGQDYRIETPRSSGGVATVERSFADDGRLESRTGSDGTTLLYAYNAEGEREVTALDVDGNSAIDYAGTDRVTRNRRSITTREGSTVERRSTEVWGAHGADTPETITTVETSLNAADPTQWLTNYGQTTTAQTVVNRAAVTLTTTTTLPDESYAVEVVTNGLLQSRTRHHSDDSILLQLSYAYDNAAENRLTTLTDLYNGSTIYDYYADGQLKSLTTPDPDTSLSGTGYDPQLTQYAYTDSAGNISRTTTLPDLSTRTETFAPTGEIESVEGSQTYPVAYTHDYAGRLQSQTTWQDKATSSGDVQTAWEYFPNGALKQKWYEASIAGDGTISGTAGKVYTYTAAGRLATETNARGTIATISYDPATNDLTGISYDDSLTAAVSYSLYDRQGRPTQITDASGTRTLRYEDGRLLGENYTAGAGTGYWIDRTLDPIGRLSAFKLKHITTQPQYHEAILNVISYGYDGASRLETVTHKGNTVIYTHDPASELRQTRTFHNGITDVLTAEERRDSLNRLQSTQTLNSSFLILNSHSYLYNSLNQGVRHTDTNGAYWNYGYDSLGQVETAVRYNSSDVVIPGYNYGYSFDDIGNRTQTTTNGRTASYTPDDLNQYDNRAIPRALDVRGTAAAGATITVEGQTATRLGDHFHHALDLSAGGNAAQQTDIQVTATLPDGGDNNAPRVADAQKSEYLAPNPEFFTHDADGNLTADGQWAYTWDAENRLIGMESLAIAYNAGTTRQKLEFAYDSQSRRFSKKVSDWDTGLWSLSSDTLFLWDGWNLVYELTANSDDTQSEKAYVWGTDLSGTLQGAGAGGVGGLLMTTHAGSVTYFPSFDGNGNVVEYFEAETGQSVAQFAYSLFGETLQATGSKASEFTHRFSTKPIDQETGLVVYELRYFNPSTGRWLSRDSIGELGGANLYGFIGNDPINGIDYLGYYRVGFLEFEDNKSFLTNVGDYFGATGSGYGQGAENIGEAGVEFVKSPYYFSQLSGTLAGNLIYDRDAFLEGAVQIYDLAALFADDPCFRASIQDELGEYFTDADNLSKLSANASIGLLTGGLAKAAQAGKLTQYLRGLERLADRFRATNKVPTRLSRVVETPFANKPTLGAPGSSDVFVTAADDLAGITSSSGAAQRLTLLDNAGNLRQGPFSVIDFDAPASGLASPVFRNNTGFMQGGFTQGGAREFVLPNLNVNQLQNVTIRHLNQ